MALANIACLLAKNYPQKKGVVMIDWDLEAPGLHRFFRDHFFQSPSDSAQQPGLIDLFLRIDEKTRSKDFTDEDEANALFDEIDIESYILPLKIPKLFLLKAGSFDDEYSKRVSSFQWDRLFSVVPWVMRAFAARLAETYQFVLIDSRTGFTDISGICTALIPNKLVVVFTPNHQNMLGAVDQVRLATTYRAQSDDLRPLGVFPLVSRIEIAERELHERWRYGDISANSLYQLPLFELPPIEEFTGYQPMFESLFKEIYGLPECDLEEYFNEIQIQHIPRYAYGEEIAVLIEKREDRLSLSRSYEGFAQRLILLDGPWQNIENYSLDRILSEKPDAAISLLTDKLQIDPTDTGALMARADLYYQQGKTEAALQDLDHAIELNPNDTRSLLKRSSISQELQRYTNALVDLRRAAEIEPNNSAIYNNRGTVKLGTGNIQEAIADFNRAIQLSPQNPYYWFSLGQAYVAAKQVQKALDTIDTAVNLKPNEPMFLFARSAIYRAEGRLNEALDDMNKAIDLQPDIDIFYLTRAEIFTQMRRIDQARDDLSQGLNNGLDQSIFHFELYRILRADRKYAEAIEELDRAMALNEDIRLRSYNNRGLLLSYLGRFPEAVENYERELNLPTQSRPNVYIFYNIAVAKACWLGLENAKTDIESSRRIRRAIEHRETGSRSLRTGRIGSHWRKQRQSNRVFKIGCRHTQRYCRLGTT
jgi:tetratricopeptide (TPR) repeat protein